MQEEEEEKVQEKEEEAAQCTLCNLPCNRLQPSPLVVVQ